MNSQNPFKVGDRAVFAPDERTIGWYQHSFERWKIYPGYEGEVTAIDSDKVELDGNKESLMYWSQFRLATDVSREEREKMEGLYRSRIK